MPARHRAGVIPLCASSRGPWRYIHIIVAGAPRPSAGRCRCQEMKTSTSVPARAGTWMPQFGPATAVAARSQLAGSDVPGRIALRITPERCASPPCKRRGPRCQGNCTLTRRSRPVLNGFPSAATTCAAMAWGAVGRSDWTGINGMEAGCAIQLIRYVPRSRS